MTPEFRTNAADAVLGTATDALVDVLQMLGQGCRRRALVALMESVFGARRCKLAAEQAVYDAVRVLNIFLIGVRFDGRLNADKEADLVSFVLERIRHRSRG